MIGVWGVFLISADKISLVKTKKKQANRKKKCIRTQTIEFLGIEPILKLIPSPPNQAKYLIE